MLIQRGFQPFRVFSDTDGGGGGDMSADEAALMADVANIGKGEGEGPLNKDDDKSVERGEDGKFVAKKDGPPKTQVDGTELDPDADLDEDDAHAAELQAKWDAEEKAEREAAEEAAKNSKPAEDEKPVAKKEEQDSAKPDTTATPFKLDLLTDAEITDPSDGALMEDLVPLRDAMNAKLTAIMEHVSKVPTGVDPALQEKIDRLEGIGRMLYDNYLQQQNQRIEPIAKEALGHIKDGYGLAIDINQMATSIQRALPGFIALGRLKAGEIPDSKTMFEMWEVVNKPKLDKLELSRKSAKAAVEDDEKEPERKAPKIAKEGGTPSNRKLDESDPNDQLELIQRDIQRNRAKS